MRIYPKPSNAKLRLLQLMLNIPTIIVAIATLLEKDVFLHYTKNIQITIWSDNYFIDISFAIKFIKNN